MIIGITGGTGSGKTTLLRLIEQMGGVVLDCDEIYHRLLQCDKELLAAIEKRFPGTVKAGAMDRKALGEQVFSNKAALKDLNGITHGAVKKEVQKTLESGPRLAAIDAIALMESGLGQLCDVTVAVTAPEEMQVERLCKRDGISEEYARKRIRAQKTPEAFAASCMYHLHNDGTEEDFRQKCLAFLQGQIIMKEKP